MELREGDGTEHLPALDRVHSHPVEVVALYLHVRRTYKDLVYQELVILTSVTEQYYRLVIELLGHQVHQLQVCRFDSLDNWIDNVASDKFKNKNYSLYLGLHRVPEEVAGRLALIFLKHEERISCRLCPGLTLYFLLICRANCFTSLKKSLLLFLSGLSGE